MESPSRQLPRRQKALSDSHIQLPRNLVLMDLGLSLEETEPEPEQNGFRRLRTIHSSLELMAMEESPPPLRPLPAVEWDRAPLQRALAAAHRGALHFTFHLLLISLFETLFFWQFVSRQEDGALTGLVNTYTNRAFSVCTNMTTQERADLRTWLSVFLNASTVLQEATVAADSRRAFNFALLRNSWLYFGGLATTFGLLTSTALLRRLPIRWGRLLGENLGMVVLLGLYEWMFFQTVALRYQAVTPAELDGMVVAEFQADC